MAARAHPIGGRMFAQSEFAAIISDRVRELGRRLGLDVLNTTFSPGLLTLLTAIINISVVILYITTVYCFDGELAMCANVCFRMGLKVRNVFNCSTPSSPHPSLYFRMYFARHWSRLPFRCWPVVNSSNPWHFCMKSTIAITTPATIGQFSMHSYECWAFLCACYLFSMPLVWLVYCLDLALSTCLTAHDNYLCPSIFQACRSITTAIMHSIWDINWLALDLLAAAIYFLICCLLFNCCMSFCWPILCARMWAQSNGWHRPNDRHRWRFRRVCIMSSICKMICMSWVCCIFFFFSSIYIECLLTFVRVDTCDICRGCTTIRWPLFLRWPSIALERRYSSLEVWVFGWVLILYVTYDGWILRK